jgi:hypothetical protein
MGAVMSVVLARLFMHAYPALAINQFAHPGTHGTEKWQSAMTYKFVGALNGLTHPNPNVMLALGLDARHDMAAAAVEKIAAQ